MGLFGARFSCSWWIRVVVEKEACQQYYTTFPIFICFFSPENDSY